MDDRFQRLCKWRAPLLTIYPPHISASPNQEQLEFGYCGRKEEESRTLLPSFLEGTPTGFILKVSGGAHNCSVTDVMVVTDTQRTELHKPTRCITFSHPHLTVLSPHLTPGPPSGSDLACGVLLYPVSPGRPIGFSQDGCTG